MKRGFTLNELLVVIALIAILSAMSWPAMSGQLKKQQVKEGAQIVADLLRNAHELTLSEQDIYGVQIEPATESISLLYYGESFEGQDPEILETKTLDEKVNITATAIIDPITSANVVRFTRAGTPSTTGTVSLSHVTENENYDWTVEVTPAGAIKVYQ